MKMRIVGLGATTRVLTACGGCDSTDFPAGDGGGEMPGTGVFIAALA